MLKFSSLFIILLTVLSPSFSQKAVSYVAFDQTVYTLYAFEGRNMVLLSETAKRDAAVMKKILAYLDQTYDDYRLALGRDPIANKLFPNKTIVAQISKNVSSKDSSTSAAGLGAVGSRTIQMGSRFFEDMINSMATKGLIDHLIYYELGRNFWFMQNKLEFNPLWLKTGGTGRGSGDFMKHGFPIFMERYIAWNRKIVFSGYGAGSKGFDDGINSWLKSYVEDDSKTFENTFLDFDNSLYTYKPTGQKFGTMDYFAAILMDLTKQFGGKAFVNSLWKNILSMPDFITVQDALDNLIISASDAAGYNLAYIFSDTYKWPVSDDALDYLESNYAEPD